MYRRLRLCSSNGGYEAIAEPPRPIDLRAARARLEEVNVPVIDARVMLIATLDCEVTVSRGGRLLFKTRELTVAERSFETLRSLLALPEMESESGSSPPGG